MANVELVSVGKTAGAARILSDINLTIADGEFVVFVGPSGCGKSTLLRVIAGLEVASAGEVRIGGRKVNDTPPAARGVAMVFQSYALYPHMTVRENMAFCLKLAGWEKAAIDESVTRAAGILAIEPLLSRKPASLSGGQRQRVAIGRAIVRQPEVFLFDEPLSNLDAALRVRMRYEFAKLHQDLKTTMIYVTHDQVEAMTLADRIVVLSEGRIEQIGAPMALYERPDNLFVAGFIGSPKMNFLEAEIVSGTSEGATVRLSSGEQSGRGRGRGGDAAGREGDPGRPGRRFPRRRRGKRPVRQGEVRGTAGKRHLRLRRGGERPGRSHRAATRVGEGTGGRHAGARRQAGRLPPVRRPGAGAGAPTPGRRLSLRARRDRRRWSR